MKFGGSGAGQGEGHSRLEHLRSAFNFSGDAEHLLDLATAGAFELVTSEAIIEEVIEVPRRKFDWSESEVRTARGALDALRQPRKG